MHIEKENAGRATLNSEAGVGNECVGAWSLLFVPALRAAVKDNVSKPSHEADYLE